MAHTFNILTSAYKNGLKYVWTGKDKNELTVKLEIYEKDATINTPTEIRGLKSIQLHVQGNQGAVTAPIVKTSLNFTLIDAPDLSTSGVKAGDWQEFFSPDATKFLVVLKRWYNTLNPEDGDEYPPYCWLGYITPDSWQEGLDYHSGITITARDNLGHLSDLPFDAQGDKNNLIKVTDLIDAALDKIAYPYDLVQNTTGDASYLKDSNGNALTASYVNVSLFKDMTWYEVLEQVLESLGLCLRWYEGVDVILQPIRNLPLRGLTSRTNASALSAELRFFGGNRMKDPAFKEITEEIDFKSEALVEVDLKQSFSLHSSYSATYNCKRYDNRSQQWRTFTGLTFYNQDTNGSTKGGWMSGYGFLDLSKCNPLAQLQREEANSSLDTGAFLLADLASNSGGANPTFRMPCTSTDITIRCQFGRPVLLLSSSNPYALGRSWGFMRKAYVNVRYVAPGGNTDYYWNGGAWQANTASLLEIPIADGMADSYSMEIPLADISETANLGGWLDIIFVNFVTEEDERHSFGLNLYGSYVWLTALETELNGAKILKMDRVRTINNASYNVKVSRKPIIGAMSAVVPYIAPKNYPGALWVYSNNRPAPYDYANYWNGFNASTAIPLPAQIHKQLLCYNHEALTTLEGSCDFAAGNIPFSLRYEFSYKGKHFILQSGTLDVLRCRFSSALFHEYIWYPDLFNENNNPAYSGTPVYRGKASSTITTMQGSSGGGGGGQGGGGVTSATATIDANTGTPYVNVTYSNGTLAFDFHNLKGETGATGPQGPQGPQGPTGPQGPSGGITSIALSLPGAFNVSPSPLTQNGTIYATLKSTYTIPTVSTMDALTGAKHTHSNKSVLDMINSSYFDYWTNAAKAVNIGTSLFQAPQIKRFKHQRNSAHSTKKRAFFISHPMMELRTDVQICLMVHRKRNGSGGAKKTHRQGWFLACGSGHAANAGFVYNHTTKARYVSIPESNILDAIAKTYCRIANTGAPINYDPYWLDMVAETDRDFGFRGSTGSRNFKMKMHFGIAIRIPNPAFDLLVDETRGALNPDTGSIRGVPRYIYSNVAPLTARMYGINALHGQEKGGVVLELF